MVEYALWLQDLTPEHHERLIRWWQDEIEGTGKVPILSVEGKPEVLRFGGGTDADCDCSGRNFCCGSSPMLSTFLRFTWGWSGT